MSDIEYTTIDAEYPVAGVDNDTQGFRDNFAAISTGLQVAKTEITDLEQRTVKLVDSTNNPASNNFNESTINNASLENTTFKLKAMESINELGVDVNVDLTRGHYQVFELGTDIGTGNTINFVLQEWPARTTNDGVSKVTVHLRGNNNENTVKFSAISSGAIFKDASWPTPDGNTDTDDSASVIVQSDSKPVIVEFWSYDQGTTVYANYLGLFVKSSDA